MFRPTLVEIARNDALRSVALPSGWQGAGFVAIEGNASLSTLAFSDIASVDFLSVQDNASLANVELGALARVSELHVSGNPQLAPGAFSAVQTFESDEPRAP